MKNINELKETREQILIEITSLSLKKLELKQELERLQYKKKTIKRGEKYG